MGCDIHVYTEHFVDNSLGARWVSCDNLRVNPYYNPSDPDTGPEFEVKELYRHRNYGLFALLANVRNYADSPYICDPKGIPHDCCQLIKDANERWDSDGHSHSYFTLWELKNYYRHNPNIKRSGYISPEAAKSLDEDGTAPETWCQGTSDRTWVHREWVDQESPLVYLIEKLEARMNDVWWNTKHRDDNSEEEKLIRIVFWFDN